MPLFLLSTYHCILCIVIIATFLCFFSSATLLNHMVHIYYTFLSTHTGKGITHISKQQSEYSRFMSPADGIE